jgi:diguanylate cyclase (GGDEF)-like protein
MATALVSMAYLGFLFHAYGAESMSYFKRMRTYTLELEQLASHDPLTGALNARAYYAACTQYIGLAKRSNQPYAVLFIDLDHFKRVNDTYGHAAGDAVLRAVSNCLHMAVRNSDFLGRIGGEEFSVFLPNTSPLGAQQLAEAIRLSIEVLHPSIGEQNLPVTASVGVAVSEGVAMGIQEIQRQADQAMYEAKSLGRNRVSVFNGAPTLGLSG